MIGLVLVSHGALADEFRAALEHVVGPQQQLETVPIGPSDDIEQRRADILEAARRADGGQGVIVCTDMFGGTPSNLALAVMGGSRKAAGKGEGKSEGGGASEGGDPTIEVLAGMNLPMLVKLAATRERGTPLDCALIGQEAARKYINVASQLLAR